MGRAKTLSRLERLDELTGLLRSGDYYTASTLAEQLDVACARLESQANPEVCLTAGRIEREALVAVAP